jgi:hypothetical protein
MINRNVTPDVLFGIIKDRAADLTAIGPHGAITYPAARDIPYANCMKSTLAHRSVKRDAAVKRIIPCIERSEHGKTP